MKKHRKQAGISLLELMLSLAVIAILIIMVTRYYLTTRTSEQVEEAASIVIALYSAGQSWLQSQDNFSGDMVSKFVADGSVPTDFSSPNANPWGGVIKAERGNTPTSLLIELENVPKEACQNLKARVGEKISNSTPDCSGGDPTIFTVNIEMGQ